MELVIRMINEQMVRAYFSISAKKAKMLYDNFSKLNITDCDIPFEEFIHDTVIRHVELNLVDFALQKRNIIPISKKDIRYLSPLKLGYPLIGVCTVAIEIDSHEFKLPEFIDFDDDDLVDKLAFNDFQKTLSEKGFYSKRESDIVEKDSVIIFDLNYTLNGKVLNSIENQEFDMENDTDIDASSLLNCKVGDRVIIDQQNELTTEVVIKTVYSKRVYDALNYDSQKIKALGYNSFAELENEYLQAKEREIYEQKLLEIIALKVLEVNDFVFSDELINHYQKIYGTSLQEIKMQYALDYLLSYLEGEDDGDLLFDEDVEQIKKELNVLNFEKRAKIYDEELLLRLAHYRLLMLLESRGIIAY